MRSFCIKVRKGEGEWVRKKLLDEGLLDQSLIIQRDDDFLYVPVLTVPSWDLMTEERDFDVREVRLKDYTAKVDLPEGLRSRLPSAFDAIGDVVIMRLEDDLLPFMEGIGRAVMDTFPRTRSVFYDGGVKGELRVRDLVLMAGEDVSETVHTEYGLQFIIDLRKAYFNPRLANERRRIAALVKDGEIVIDMFAGVGPFSIMIARYAKAEMVYAIDLNEEAVEMMVRNIERNKVGNVVPVVGDARQCVFDLPCADRMIMNLPHSAIDFYADALTRLKLGGTMHLYHICDRSSIDDTIKHLETTASGMGVIVGIDRMEELKTYSPSASVFAIDLLLVGWL